MEPVSNQLRTGIAAWIATVMITASFTALTATAQTAGANVPAKDAADSSAAPAAASAPAAGHAPDTSAAESESVETASEALPAPAPATVAASSVPSASPEPSLKQKVAGWERKELGISVSGQASSRFLQSAISGDSARITQPGHENHAFSRADVEFLARPSATTSGKVLFRIHQDWSNYYDEGPNPLLARWFSYDGTIVDGKVAFDIGDFRAKFSPLTLYSPGLDLLYEPEIFTGRRRMAMDEWHLTDENLLPLQGLHAVYTQGLTQNAGIEAGVAGARLRTGGASQFSWVYWTDDVEKLMASGYAKVNLFQALEVGATRIQIVDPVPTSRSINNEYNALTPSAIFENVTVNAVNLGLDGKRFLGNGPVSLRLDGELAMSGYRNAHDVADSVGTRSVIKVLQNGSLDTVEQTRYALKLVKDKEIKGQALRASLHAGYRETEAGPFSLALNASFLKNDKDYVNDVAQSPSFIGTRIFNSANGVGGFQRGYNSFDAMYDHVYTVDPVTNINTSEFWFQDTKIYNGTNNWYRAAQFKNSYRNSVTTKSERDFLAGAMDPHLQLLYPFGPATPNRQGVDASLKASALEGMVEATVLFAALKELEGFKTDPATATEAATLGRMGGGAKVEAGKLLGLKNRITASAGYVADSRKNPAYNVKDTSFAEWTFKSAMLSAGVYAGIWKGLAVLAGYQQIKSNPFSGVSGSATAKSVNEADLKQSIWSLGLEYRIAPGAYVTGEYGMIGFDEAKSATEYSQAVSSLNLIVGF
ncbi:MAG: hypothetical protein JWP91_2947 [Fibrobacteres bacterium]|nr:hypothetical protein [Fibrobacterota bacterium]